MALWQFIFNHEILKKIDFDNSFWYRQYSGIINLHFRVNAFSGFSITGKKNYGLQHWLPKKITLATPTIAKLELTLYIWRKHAVYYSKIKEKNLSSSTVKFCLLRNRQFTWTIHEINSLLVVLCN